MVIWKFDLRNTSRQEISMPSGAEILSVEKQGDKLRLWAMVDPRNSEESRFIEVFGTGQPIPVDMGVERKFLNTVITPPFVWHVFERL